MSGRAWMPGVRSSNQRRNAWRLANWRLFARLSCHPMAASKPSVTCSARRSSSATSSASSAATRARK
eukprot:4682560-Alexandrium_andersonii.AAC.1